MEEIFKLVQEAYKIEIGTSGPAFKCADQYTTRLSVLNDLPDMWIIRSGNTSNTTNIKGRSIVACGKGTIDDLDQIVYIGPLAVKPDYQVWQILLCHKINFKCALYITLNKQ